MFIDKLQRQYQVCAEPVSDAPVPNAACCLEMGSLWLTKGRYCGVPPAHHKPLFPAAGSCVGCCLALDVYVCVANIGMVTCLPCPSPIHLDAADVVIIFSCDFPSLVCLVASNVTN